MRAKPQIDPDLTNRQLVEEITESIDRTFQWYERDLELKHPKLVGHELTSHRGEFYRVVKRYLEAVCRTIEEEEEDVD